MKKLSLCILWTFISCGPTSTPNLTQTDLIPFLSIWKEDAQTHNYSPEILSKFEFQDNLKFLEAGRCDAETRTIILSKEIWFKMDSTQRMILVYHEMGHCELGRPDKTDLMKDKPKPASLMHPILIRPIDFLENREYYVNELFNG